MILFNDTSHEIAFDICIESMVRLIEKYEENNRRSRDKNIKSEDSCRYPADNTESSAVVCNRETISARKRKKP